MKNEQDIILILDSILDDYYQLWECFEEYKQNIKTENDYKARFLESLKEAYKNKYLDFFIGKNYNGDEELIPQFDLTNFALEELLDYRNNLANEVRVTTSKFGIEFLKKYECR